MLGEGQLHNGSDDSGRRGVRARASLSLQAPGASVAKKTRRGQRAEAGGLGTCIFPTEERDYAGEVSERAPTRTRLRQRMKGISTTGFSRSLVRGAILCLLGVMVGASWSLGEVRTAVFPLQPLGVDTTSAEAASALLSDCLIRTEKFAVIRCERRCYYVSCASEIGRELDAQKAVIGKLAKLDGSLLLSLTLVDVQSKRVDFSDRLRASSEGEIDIVVERAARGLSERRRFRDIAEPQRTTEVTKRPVRPRGSVAFGVYGGYLFSVRGSALGGRGGFAFSLGLRHDLNELVVEGRMGLAECEGVRDLHLGLFLDKILGNGDFAPYLEAGLGAHRLTDSGTPGTRYGLGLNLGGGIVGPRVACFNAIVGGKYRIIFQTKDLPVVQRVAVSLGLTTGG